MKSIPFYTFGLFLMASLTLVKCTKEPVFDPTTGQAFTELKNKRPEQRPQLPLGDTYTAFRSVYVSDTICLIPSCSLFAYEYTTHFHPLINALDGMGWAYQYPAFTGNGYDIDGSGGVGYGDYISLLPYLGYAPNHNMPTLNVTPFEDYSSGFQAVINQDLIIGSIQMFAQGDTVAVQKSYQDEVFSWDTETYTTPLRTTHLSLPNGGAIYYAIQN